MDGSRHPPSPSTGNAPTHDGVTSVPRTKEVSKRCLQNACPQFVYRSSKGVLVVREDEHLQGATRLFDIRLWLLADAQEPPDENGDRSVLLSLPRVCAPVAFRCRHSCGPAPKEN